MNYRKVKHRWNVCKIFLIGGTTFWLSETICFIFMYGWHYRAINEAEKLCDNIARGIWDIGIIYFVVVAADVIQYVLSIFEEE